MTYLSFDLIPTAFAVRCFFAGPLGIRPPGHHFEWGIGRERAIRAPVPKTPSGGNKFFIYSFMTHFFAFVFSCFFSTGSGVLLLFSSCKQQAFYKRLSNIVAPRKRVYCMRLDMWFKPRTWLVFLSNTNPVQVQGAVGICPVRTCGNDVNLQTRLRLIIHRLVYYICAWCNVYLIFVYFCSIPCIISWICWHVVKNNIGVSLHLHSEAVQFQHTRDKRVLYISGRFFFPPTTLWYDNKS